MRLVTGVKQSVGDCSRIKDNSAPNQKDHEFAVDAEGYS